MAFWIIIHIDLFEYSKLLQALSLLELEIQRSFKGKDDQSTDPIRLVDPACRESSGSNCFAN